MSIIEVKCVLVQVVNTARAYLGINSILSNKEYFYSPQDGMLVQYIEEQF